MKNDLPKISVVTPSFNQAAFLESTIHSILTQNYPDLEYIIIDGGSTDGSVDIIKKYEKQISYWISEPDGGHYAAVNKGFSRSTGEVMSWLNSDDMYCPWSLHTIGSIFRELDNVQWACTLNPITWNRNGLCSNIWQVPGYSPTAFSDEVYTCFGRPYSGFIQQESTFWRRGLWEKAGGLDLKYKLAGDMALWAKFFEHAKLHGVHSPLGGFRVHESNRSRDIEAYIKEARDVLEQYRHSNPQYVSAPRKLMNRLIKKTPIVRRLIRFYEIENIYRSSLEDGDKWCLHGGRF